MSEDWSEVVSDKTEETVTEISNNMTRGERIESMLNVLQNAMDSVYQGHFDYAKAERMAALALTAQMELAKFSADAEWRAKHAKLEIKHVSAEANYKYRTTTTEKKLSEAALEQLVNRDPNVIKAELNMAEIERDSKQWQNYYGTLKDAHIFFRNLGKV